MIQRQKNSVCAVHCYDLEFNDETFSYIDIYANDGYFINMNQKSRL